MRLERVLAVDDPEAQTGELLDRIAQTLRNYVVFQSDAEVIHGADWVQAPEGFERRLGRRCPRQKGLATEGWHWLASKRREGCLELLSKLQHASRPGG